MEQTSIMNSLGRRSHFFIFFATLSARTIVCLQVYHEYLNADLLGCQ